MLWAAVLVCQQFTMDYVVPATDRPVMLEVWMRDKEPRHAWLCYNTGQVNYDGTQRFERVYISIDDAGRLMQILNPLWVKWTTGNGKRVFEIPLQDKIPKQYLWPYALKLSRPEPLY